MQLIYTDLWIKQQKDGNPLVFGCIQRSSYKTCKLVFSFLQIKRQNNITEFNNEVRQHAQLSVMGHATVLCQVKSCQLYCTTIHCVSKNNTDVTEYNFDEDQPILIFLAGNRDGV